MKSIDLTEIGVVFFLSVITLAALLSVLASMVAFIDGYPVVGAILLIVPVVVMWLVTKTTDFDMMP